MTDQINPEDVICVTNIGGSGGGGGGKFGGSNKTAGGEEAPNTLKSKQVARLIDLIGEGPIKGVVGTVKGTYFDGVQVRRPDNTWNFKDANIQFVNGYPAQSRMKGFPSAEAEESVGVQLKKDFPIVRNIINTDADRCRVTVSVPSLEQFQKDGDIVGTNVEFRIEVNNNGGGYKKLGDYKIEGKTTSTYQRSYTFTLKPPGPWDIRLSRLTDDSKTQKLINDLFWDSFTGIIDDKINYSNSACVGIIIDAEQFQQIPKRVYDVEGLLINYPKNYDPIDGTYAGPWDGTFLFGWCNNPAWCLYDMIVNNRYGLGDYIPASMVDKYSFYKAAVWCDQLVLGKDGKTKERRYTLNVSITDQEEAFDLLMQMSSVFRGFSYWSGGQLVLVADQPDDPTDVFTNANVIDGQFSYSSTDYRQRHTVVTVSWQDPEQLGEVRQAVVEDKDSIDRFGLLPSQEEGFGCTREGQAVRQGKWTLFTEQYEDDSVTFKTGLQGTYVRPGNIIKVMDATVAGKRRGGRIGEGSTYDTIVFDAPIAVTAGHSYVISITIPVGDDQSVQTRMTEPVEVSGRVSSLSVPSGFSQKPQAGQVWVITEPTLEATLWRAMTIKQTDTDLYQIEAVRHYDEKWAYVERNQAFAEKDTTDIVAMPPAVRNAKVREYVTQISSISLQVMASFSWTSLSPLFDVYYHRVNNNWRHIRTDQHAIELAVSAGDYEFQVSPIGTLGIKGPMTMIKYRVVGLSAPPLPPKQLKINVVDGVAMFQWIASTEIDVVVGGRYELRFSPQISGATWNTAQIVVPAVPGSASSVEANYQIGTWMLRTFDIENRPSDSWATVIALAADSRYVEFFRECENPDWSGLHEGTRIKMPQEWLCIGDNGGDWDDQPDNVSLWPEIDVLPLIPGSERTTAEGLYTFEKFIDAGGAFSVRLSTEILAFPFFNISETIDERTTDVDTWPNWDDMESSLDGGVQIEMRTTLDDPATADAIWTEWKSFVPGENYGRGFAFRARLTATLGQNIGIETLCITADLRNKVDAGEDVKYTTEFTRVYYRLKFYTIPAVVITVQNAVSTDNITIDPLTKTNEYFEVRIANASNVPQVNARTFDWHAQGY
jgi:hypothetical protein